MRLVEADDMFARIRKFSSRASCLYTFHFFNFISLRLAQQKQWDDFLQCKQAKVKKKSLFAGTKSKAIRAILF
jgi:hypothetical protein